MLTKEQFIECINFIYKQRELGEGVVSALEQLCPGETLQLFIYGAYEDILVKVLQADLNDTNDIIGYKLYEFDDLSKTNKKEQLAYTPEVASWETVYNFLVANAKEVK